MHSSPRLREGVRPEIVRDNLGHANIDVTQIVYGKSWWEERVDAVTQADHVWLLTPLVRSLPISP